MTIGILFLIGIVLIVFILTYLVYSDKLLLGFAIITFLTIPSNLSEILRTFVQIIDILIIAYLFFSNYGFDLKNYPEVPKAIIVFLSIFYTSLFLSVLFSDFSFSGMRFIVRSVVFFIIVYQLYGIIRDQNYVRVVLLSIFISGFILVSSIIIDFILQGRGLAYLFEPVRELQYGIYSNYNVTGSYAIIVFPFIILGLSSKSLKKVKILILVCGIILFSGVLLLASRAALFGIILGTAVVLFFKNKKLFVIFISSLVIIISVYFLLNPFGQSLDYALRLQNGLSGHDQYWELAKNLFIAHPIFGIGPGSYPYLEFNYFPVLLDSFVGRRMILIHNLTSGAGGNNSHSFYLTMLSDMGIFGLMTVITLLSVFFRTSYLTYRKYRGKNSEVISIIILIITTGICLTFRGFVETSGVFYYGTISTDLPFWLFFIILLSYQRNRFNFKSNE